MNKALKKQLTLILWFSLFVSLILCLVSAHHFWQNNTQSEFYSNGVPTLKLLKNLAILQTTTMATLLIILGSIALFRFKSLLLLIFCFVLFVGVSELASGYYGASSIEGPDWIWGWPKAVYSCTAYLCPSGASAPVGKLRWSSLLENLIFFYILELVAYSFLFFSNCIIKKFKLNNK